jgi:hypothetical protein
MATKKKQSKKKKAPKKKALKKLTRKRVTLKKKPKRKPVPKRAAAKTKLSGKKTTARKKARSPKKRAAAKSPSVDTAAFTREGQRARSGGQSGDLQGLSNREGAASESVDELLEEGNAFEADVVKGVEDAGDEGEVHTHEVPEDDVPGEYLDEE